MKATPKLGNLTSSVVHVEIIRRSKPSLDSYPTIQLPAYKTNRRVNQLGHHSHSLSLSLSLSFSLSPSVRRASFSAMLFSLKAPPTYSLFVGDGSVPAAFFHISRLSIVRFPLAEKGSSSTICASKGASSRSLSAVVFEPFEEVKKELSLVPSEPHVSLARQKFSEESEAVINEQIK